MLIEWTDDLDIGIPQFDEEHRQLVDLVNRLHESLARNPDVTQAEAGLAEFRDHVARHFAAEDTFLKETGNPRYENHKALHEILLKDLDEILTRVRQTGFTYLREELELDIRPWLLEHIQNVDSRMKGD